MHLGLLNPRTLLPIILWHPYVQMHKQTNDTSFFSYLDLITIGLSLFLQILETLDLFQLSDMLGSFPLSKSKYGFFILVQIILKQNVSN